MNLSTHARMSVEYAALAFVLVFATVGFAHADLLTRQLDQGMAGSDVSTLQTFLARDISVYPQRLVTGFFGPLTFSAVSNLQSKNGIQTAGRVGPITLAFINARLAGGITTGDRSAPLITTVNIATSQTGATVSWTTNENATGRLHYSTGPIGISENDTSSAPGAVLVSGTAVETVTPGFQTMHSVQLSNLQPNTTYYYAVRATDQASNVSITWPATFRTN